MIIFGTKTTTSTRESGTFHCPRCGAGKPYNLKAVKRWFSLYFIPVIPLGDVGTYVECGNCAGTFDESVRTYDPEAEKREFRASFEQAMAESLAAMALEDGTVADGEIETIANVLTQLTGRAHEASDVRTLVDDIARRKLTMEQILTRVSGSLNDRGKEMIIQALNLVASADGQITEKERALLIKAGGHLGLRRNEVESLLDRLALPA
jgi:uncharacterized membrane protein YebE (DUF533 family)